MHTNFRVMAAALLGAAAAGCASMSDEEASQRAMAVMKASFNERGQDIDIRFHGRLLSA